MRPSALALTTLVVLTVGVANAQWISPDFWPRGGNEWWIQAHVRSDTPVTGVTAAVDYGDFRPLSLRSWGDWAGSYHAPRGSTVRFAAHYADGSITYSQCYEWPLMEPLDCNPRTAFIPKGGNEWWVAVAVTPEPDIVRVMDSPDGEFDVNAADWLSKTSWGTWAGRTHIEPGNMVRFEAEYEGWVNVGSCMFTHPGGTLVRCPERWEGFDPTMDAKFVNPRGNTWWVEVDVRAPEPVATVNVTIIGTVHELERTAWGSWATNVNVPEGRWLYFVAESASGKIDYTGSYGWPPPPR